MNATNINQMIIRSLRQCDPGYFGNKCDPTKRSPRDLTLDVLGQVVDKTCQDSPGDADEVIWKIRAELASMAEKLGWAMDTLFEQDAGSLPSNQTRETFVVQLVMRQLDRAFGGDVPAVLQDLVGKVVAHEGADLPADCEVVELGGMARTKLVKVSLYLQRASACIWTLAMHRARASAATPETAVDDTVGPAEKPATSAATSVYLKALTKFAATLAALNIDPATLPVGEEAVAEAKALCAVRYFIDRRYSELRRWVHPQAAVELDKVPHAEVCADLGEQLLIWHHGPASANAHDANNWTWRGHVEEREPEAIGDLLVALEHAAEALGIDWDRAVGAGARNHDRDLEEDALAGT